MSSPRFEGLALVGGSSPAEPDHRDGLPQAAARRWWRRALKIPRVLLSTFAATLALRSAENVAASKDAVVTLPKMSVGAGVPLVKVGELTLRERRFAPAAAAAGDFIYVTGGLAADQAGVTAVERVDVRSGHSEVFAVLRSARFWHATVLVEGKLFVLGGTTPGLRPGGSSDLEASLEIVDLATGGVTRGPDLPQPRRSFGCVALGGKIYVIGGQREHRGRVAATNTVVVFDVPTQKWSEGPPMHTPRDAAAVAVDGGFIIVPGGYDLAKGALNVVEVLDPRENAWRELPPLVRRMSAHSLAFLGRHLFLFGDYETPGEILAYDLRSRKSEVFTLGYRAARHAAALAHRGRIYVIGGRETKEAAPLDIIQIFEPVGPAASP